MIPILLLVAILGYLSVILESPIRINKTITALLLPEQFVGLLLPFTAMTINI